jgi:two-component system, NtrC family, sensor histidine kinase HydH
LRWRRPQTLNGFFGEEVRIIASTLKVLAIEDDPDTRANLCDILELDGHHVQTAATVQEALDRSNWTEFSVILMDRKLPDGSADSLLPQIKQLAPDAAVIIVTGHTDLDGTITALRQGAADYMLKPINADALRASLARVAKLQHAEQRAVQAERLAAIGQMISVMTHESRNALQRSKAFLEELSDQFQRQPESLLLITGVQRALDHLKRLFEEVTAYGSPMKLDRTRSNLANIWRQVWADIEPTRKGREITLRETVDQVDTTCSVDYFRVGQVLRNLLENALAACTDPVVIEIDCADAQIAGTPAIRIAVRDNGPGLTQEQRERIFEPFYTTKASGTGLGMAITKRIVEAHGGQIAVGNHVDSKQGAEMVIMLPRGGLQ